MLNFWSKKKEETVSSNSKVQIIICATMRSGSTMICEDMRNTKSLGRAKEFLMNWRPRGAMDFREQLAKIIDENCSDNGVFSVKVMSKYLPFIEDCLAKDSNVTGSDTFFPNFANAFDNPIWIYLKREDILGQAISRYISNATGVFHNLESQGHSKSAQILSEKGEKNYNKDINYNYGLINISLQNSAREHTIWDHFFKTNGIEPIRLTYEDCIDDYESYLNTIADAAQITLETTPKKRTIKKLANAHNDRFREQFQQDMISKIKEETFSDNTPPSKE